MSRVPVVAPFWALHAAAPAVPAGFSTGATGTMSLQPVPSQLAYHLNTGRPKSDTPSGVVSEAVPSVVRTQMSSLGERSIGSFCDHWKATCPPSWYALKSRYTIGITRSPPAFSAQLQPGSTAQVAEQPSPSRALP